MCGILCLVRGSGGSASTAPLVSATQIARHRGPDDEGYLLWARGSDAAVYAGTETAPDTTQALRLPPLPAAAEWTVAFGHRRLSILDLSPAGHQPTLHRRAGLALTYNGEIYNYIELRKELEALGHSFDSDGDTEVLLASWAEWGEGCLNRLNGMFAFAVLDQRAATLHVVRDRFGVKPLYIGWAGDVLAFASEPKQLRTLPGYTFALDESSTRDYLATGALDHSRYTLDASIQQLLGGEVAVVNLRENTPHLSVRRWYEPSEQTWRGSDADARARFRELLTDSIRLRFRSDVPVGSCLSGGLDSSAIVCLANAIGREAHQEFEQTTITACFDDAKYDEWHYADMVVRQTGVQYRRVYPSAERLRVELDHLLWHMDEPFGSTSQFSQWCVFSSASATGLTVMLDGQGSDEQLAGYHGSTRTSHLTGLLRRGELATAAMELATAARTDARGAASHAVLAARNVFPALDRVMPDHLRRAPELPSWCRLNAATRVDARLTRDLNDSLRRQTLASSLPALLRYEDRTSMAWSIEARVPFLDYRLVEFLSGVPDHLKLHRGRTKVILRDALEGVLPEPIRDRRDKMGFVTPEERWLRDPANGWLRDGIVAAASSAPDIFDAGRVRQLVDDVVAERTAFTFAPWRIFCLGRWLSSMRMAGAGLTRSRVEA